MTRRPDPTESVHDDKSSAFCTGHPKLIKRLDQDEFRTKFFILLLGGNLVCIIVTIVLQIYTTNTKIPEMEASLSAKITPIVERLARLEEWKCLVDKRLDKVAK